MRSAIARITLKIIELLGSIACFIAKVITDLEARRVFIRNQKFSREWSLVHNVTWSTAGNTFANITYGGFSLITLLMLISRCIDANSRPSLIEKIFLIVGMLCFFAMGGLVLAAFDQVPWELHDNSIILGCLSFFVALVMLYDLSDPMARQVTDMTQTDNVYTNPAPSTATTTTSPTSMASSTRMITTVTQANQTDPQSESSNKIDSSTQIHHSARNSSINTADRSNVNTNNIPNIGTNDSNDQIDDRNVTYTQIQTIQSKHMQPTYYQKQQHHHHQTNNIDNHATTTLDSPDVKDITRNGHYHRSDNIDFVHMQHLPQAEQPVFERVLLPEKKRPTFNKVADPHAAATVIQTVHSPDGYIESHIRSMDYLDDKVNYNHNHNQNNVQKRNTPKYGNSSSRQQQQQHLSATANTIHTSQQHQYQHKQRQYHNNGSANGITTGTVTATGTDNNNMDRTIYAKPLQQIIYNPNQSYAYDENSNSEDHHRINNDGGMHDTGPKYTMNPKNSRRSSNNDLNRYGNAAPVIHDQYSYQHNQQPMMVIRNYNSQIASPNMNVKHSTYNHPTAMSTEQQLNYLTVAHHSSNNIINHQSQVPQQQQQQQRNLNNSTRNYGGISTNASTHGTRSGIHHQNQCCQNDSDEPVDFRKMNAAIKPGYVASAAKMWDRRAVENSTDLNTIV